MNVMVTIPDDLAEHFGGDIGRQTLEALALDAYQTNKITKGELRRILGIESRLQLDAFLKSHNVYDPYTLADLEAELATLDRLDR